MIVKSACFSCVFVKKKTTKEIYFFPDCLISLKLISQCIIVNSIAHRSQIKSAITKILIYAKLFKMGGVPCRQTRHFSCGSGQVNTARIYSIELCDKQYLGIIFNAQWI